MLTKIKSSWAIVILLAISIFLCAKNYSPGTYLSGWDTLHPEFNFGLNFERTINGVFRPEQGLGAVAAHSHMADLPRVVILYFAHFILPTDFLRYFYIDLCIVLGTIGMYFLLKKHFLKKESASFLGALFYLLNIGTVQTFNVPFEMFTTLFATLPFIFYFATSYLHDINQQKTNAHKRTQNLLFFSIAIILNSPSAYAATLWYIFFLCFSTYFFLYSLVNFHHSKHWLKHFLILIFTTISINLFWLMPNLYFILVHAKEVAGANINLLFSDQAFLKNKEFGNIADILLLKSFYFDWKIYALNNQFIDLLLPFINHLKNIVALSISFVLAGGFIAGGFIYAKKLKLKSLPIFIVLIICLFFLFNNNFPFSLIYGFLQNHLPFFKEALRFPDDKILNIFVFLISILFGIFCLFISEKLKTIYHKHHLDKLFVVLISVLIIYYSLPSFTGNFINPLMRVKIPNQYFQLFNYLNKQPENLRVANLPIASPWGWVYYDWSKNSSSPSYQGAGFLYFGIQQPLLDRDFDRWSPYNESYYREMSYAIYKQDSTLLTNVLKKYKIGFVFVDKSIINPQNSSNALYLEQTEMLLVKTKLIKNKHNFGTINLYEINNDSKIIGSITTSINVNPKTTTAYNDIAYQEFGNYITTTDSTKFSNITYPFRDLINNQSKINENIISDNTKNIIFTSNIKASGLQVDTLSKSLKTIPIEFIAKRNANVLMLTLMPKLPVLNTTQLAKPITQNITLPNSSSNLYFSINSGDLIDLNNLPKNSSNAIGNAVLINGSNTISIFNKQNAVPILNTQESINPFFSSCSDNGPSPTAGIQNNGLKVSGIGNLCILIPYGFLPKLGGELSTILTNFQFNFIGTGNISACLLDLQSSICTDYKNPIIVGNTFSFTYPVISSELQKKALKIFIKPNDLNQNTYMLTNINASYAKSVVDFNLSKDSINKMFTNINNVSFNKITIPKNNIYNSTIDITKTSLISDCKAVDAKKEIIDQDGVKTIKYSSSLGSFCDHFSLPNLPHNQSYVITITSKNESGLPLTLCVSNYTSRRCDIYSDLNNSGMLKKDIFLLPAMDEGGIGYDLNLENLGIKGTTSINSLFSLEIMPIPYSFLENIKSQNLNENSYIGNVNSFEKYSSWLYVAKAPTSPTILTLYKSFEPGFKAYQVNCSFGISCLIKGLLAPFYASQINEHVLVNNWANGWILDNSTKQDNAQMVAIIFLPQYLEILGFLVLLFTYILLIYHSNIHHHNNH